MIQSKNSNNEWTKTDEMVFKSDIEASHAKNDVSIISKKAYQEARQSIHKGFCHNRFQPNLVISMCSDEAEHMKMGVELDIEGVKLFVLHKKHRCHENCPLFMMNNQPCQWTNYIYYACIIKGGMVKKGLSVVIRTP